MGKITGFLEAEREKQPYRPVEQRLLDWNQVMPDKRLHHVLSGNGRADDRRSAACSTPRGPLHLECDRFGCGCVRDCQCHPDSIDSAGNHPPVKTKTCWWVDE